KYGSLEELLDNAEEVTAAKVRANLLDGRQQAALYKRLATVVTDIPLETPWESWSYLGPDLPVVSELCARLEFRTLGRRIEGLAPRWGLASTAEGAGGPTDAVEAPAVATPFVRLETAEEIDAWAERARRTGSVAVRAIQVGGSGRTGSLRGVA